MQSYERFISNHLNNSFHPCASPNGYCSKCKTLVCEECTHKDHFTHVEAIKHQSVNIAERINYLCKIKFEVAKALHLREMLRKTEAKALVKAAERDFKKDSAEFKGFITKHKEAVVELSLIHICRCRRLLTCRSRWSPYH
eukprot:TRINITY_DN26105_c0_g1_i2.p2 TRINITY_DN26105_c0_g1~~TRINITY_DN26105_c0_g1_i2.p2  ORF type:complete len:140 (+),score=24.69 TRINITY_DN26105_c0_g1_i2:76-495(+)